MDAMDMSDLLTLVLMLLGVLALLGVAVIGFVMWRYRIPPRGLIAMIGALVYLASPVDVLPEVMLGPLGLLDDAGAVTAAAVFVYKLVTVKRRLQDAGVKGRRRPDLLESAYARFRPLVALCARPVHGLAMTAMLKSQRGLSDLSLLARSQLEQPRFASGRSRRTGNRSAHRRRRKTDGDEDPYRPLEGPVTQRRTVRCDRRA